MVNIIKQSITKCRFKAYLEVFLIINVYLKDVNSHRIYRENQLWKINFEEQ